jgi:hypothetical protein
MIALAGGDDLISRHEKAGKIVTLTSVQPTGRFGVMEIKQ